MSTVFKYLINRSNNPQYIGGYYFPKNRKRAIYKEDWDYLYSIPGYKKVIDRVFEVIDTEDTKTDKKTKDKQESEKESSHYEKYNIYFNKNTRDLKDIIRKTTDGAFLRVMMLSTRVTVRDHAEKRLKRLEKNGM